MYAWNARTRYLDTLAERTGLEIISQVLSPFTWAKDKCALVWNRYIYLINVEEENQRLKKELASVRQTFINSAEENLELERLRNLLSIEALKTSSGFGAKVIAMQFGPNSLLKTLAINKGYTSGAMINSPVVAPDGIVGKIYRISPHASTVLLLTDPNFRVLGISQKSRTLGIVKGSSTTPGMLEMEYVAQNAAIEEGEILITAGTDETFPKGIAIGVVTKVAPGKQTLFMQVEIKPFVQAENLEEVVILLNNLDATPSGTTLDAGSINLGN